MNDRAPHSKRLDESGQGLVQIMVIGGILLAIVAGVMQISNVQQGALALHKHHEDFYEALSALGLVLESPSICQKAFKNVNVTPGPPGQPGPTTDVSTAMGKLGLPSYLLMQKGTTISGQTIQSVTLGTMEDVGPIQLVPGGPNYETYVAQIQVKTQATQGVGALNKLFNLPLMIFLNGTQVYSCNASDALLEYLAYAKPVPAGSAPATMPRKIVQKTPAVLTVKAGSTGQVSCPTGSYLVGASYRFLQNSAGSSNFNVDWTPVQPPMTDQSFSGTTVQNPGALVALSTTPPQPMPVNWVPSCGVNGGKSGAGAQCQLFCIAMVGT